MPIGAQPTTMHPMRRTTLTSVAGALGLFLVLTAGACSSDSKDDAVRRGQEERWRPRRPRRRWSAPRPPRSGRPRRPARSRSVVIEPASPDGTSASGSGCAPQSPTLPDGQWFGRLKAIDTTAGTIGFDLECFFVGDAANAAATADGQTEVPVPDDVYIRNESETVRTQHAVTDVAVGVLGSGGASTDYEPGLSGLSSAGAGRPRRVARGARRLGGRHPAAVLPLTPGLKGASRRAAGDQRSRLA